MNVTLTKSTGAELGQVVARADQLLSEYEEIAAASTRARELADEAEQELRSAINRLEVTESNALLNGGATETHAARQAATKARDARDAAAAAARGLNSRRSAHEEQLIAMAEELRVARIPWAASHLQRFLAEYRQAANNLLALARKGIVIGQAIGKSMDGLEQTVVLDPTDPFTKLFEIRPEELNDRYWTGVDLTKTDAKLKAIFESIAGELGRAHEVDYLVGEIKRRRRENSEQSSAR